MIIFIGAIGKAITAVLLWGIANAELMLQLLSMAAAGVALVRLMRNGDGPVYALPQR